MDYEKKYKELVGKIENAYLYAQTDSTKAVLEEIRPELKEGKGERIRKVIYGWICNQPAQDFENGFSKEEMLVWLERQREQKSAWKPSSEQMKFLWKYAEQNNYDGRVLTSLYNDLKKLKGEKL